MFDAKSIELCPKKQTHSFTQPRSQNTLMYAMLVDGLSYGVICIANCGTFYSSSFFYYTPQNQQAGDFGRWGALADGVICGKSGEGVL